MPNGGRLTVASRHVPPDHVEVAIMDTGGGIPEDNIRRVFEPLFTTKSKGIGRGLALVKTLVEGYGGSVAVKSKVGEETAFTVRLPVGVQE